MDKIERITRTYTDSPKEGGRTHTDYGISFNGEDYWDHNSEYEESTHYVEKCNKCGGHTLYEDYKDSTPGFRSRDTYTRSTTCRCNK